MCPKDTFPLGALQAPCSVACGGVIDFFRSLDFSRALKKYSQGSNINNMNQELRSQIAFTFPDIELQRKWYVFLRINIENRYGNM